MNIGSGMLLDRTIQPKVRDIEHLAVQMPQRCTMPNGVSLNVLDSGDNEVVRIDLLMEGGAGNSRNRYRLCLRTVCCAKGRFGTVRGK